MRNSTEKESHKGSSVTLRLAKVVGAVFNPFVLFTALFAATAFSVAEPWEAAAFVGIELIAVGFLVAYLLRLRSRSSSGFWLPVREERLIPAFVLAFWWRIC